MPQRRKKTNQTIEIKNENEQDVVYLSEGQGSETKGDGSQQNPYENIHTALDKVKDGGTTKILGTIYYTKYKVHTDRSALPLFINKNITIEGGSNDSTSYLGKGKFKSIKQRHIGRRSKKRCDNLCSRK